MTSTVANGQERGWKVVLCESKGDLVGMSMCPLICGGAGGRQMGLGSIAMRLRMETTLLRSLLKASLKQRKERYSFLPNLQERMNMGEHWSLGRTLAVVSYVIVGVTGGRNCEIFERCKNTTWLWLQIP